MSTEKSEIIVEGDPDSINAMVVREHSVVERITIFEKKRAEATKDIAIVLNKDPKTLTLSVLTELLASRKKESDALKEIHDKLSATMSQMVRVNEQNKVLLQESIDMIQFEMNIVQSMKQGPSNANYQGMDYADNDYGFSGSFDAKQ